MDNKDDVDKLLSRHLKEAVAGQVEFPPPERNRNRGWIIKTAVAAVLVTVPALFLSSLNVGNLSAEVFTGLYKRNETTTTIVSGLRRANEFVSRLAQEENDE